MGKYAEGTEVPVERSKAEVERILSKYGADQFASGWAKNIAVISFRMKNRYIRIEMPLPVHDTKSKNYNTTDKVARESRRRWRSIVLYIKAKLDSVESEIVSFEEAFMAHIVLPNRQTVGQFMQPQIEAAYAGGQMPLMLPGLGPQ